ncbi:hypothetical protein [Pedobacter ureilyticus]|uniref:Uncharacterized protein n=1 Tax=Pedobacter ureilyticus TaxID=1393051 RepID=A0ABW9J747_9SPHI|nr:hypothetical protein [Pedobacter helvus]
MTLLNLIISTWQDFAILFLLVYASVVTGFLLGKKKSKPVNAQIHSNTFGYDDDRRPFFYGEVTKKQIVDHEDKKHIHLTLTFTNFGKQIAYDVKAMWFDENDNWPNWNADVKLNFERPHKVGDLKYKEAFDINLACEVENVVDKRGNDVFFYFFAVEVEFKQSNGETCSQVITCVNFSDEFYLQDSGNVLRYFE